MDIDCLEFETYSGKTSQSLTYWFAANQEVKYFSLRLFKIFDVNFAQSSLKKLEEI